jgi:hypothetical protein
MKKIHYRHIGLPKTGTTWLWLQLSTHPDIDFFDKSRGLRGQQELLEKNSLKEKSFDSITEYENFYKEYDISLNFDTWFFSNIDPKITTNINTPVADLATHISMSFRNPYDHLESWFNFYENKNCTQSQFMNFTNKTFMELTNYKKIFDDWKSYKIKGMFYEDMIIDPKQYVKNVCDFLEIKEYYNVSSGRLKVRKTDYIEKLKWVNDDVIAYIDNQISYVEDFMHRDLSHWKKNK